MKETHCVLERGKKDAGHSWWDTPFGWSPTATGVLNKLCHPILVLLILVLIGFVLSAILHIMNCRMMKRLTQLTSVIDVHNLDNIPSTVDTPKVIDTR